MLDSAPNLQRLSVHVTMSPIAGLFWVVFSSKYHTVLVPQAGASQARAWLKGPCWTVLEFSSLLLVASWRYTDPAARPEHKNSRDDPMSSGETRRDAVPRSCSGGWERRPGAVCRRYRPAQGRARAGAALRSGSSAAPGGALGAGPCRSRSVRALGGRAQRGLPAAVGARVRSVWRGGHAAGPWRTI